MADARRRRVLEQAGLVHARPEAVRAVPFVERPDFFAAYDKVQVKYEMLRAQAVDGLAASEAAAAHGYSRAAFYLTWHAFEQRGMVGLLDERPGRRGPLKLTPDVVAFLEVKRREQPSSSAAQLQVALERALGVQLHRRTIERLLGAARRSAS